MLSFFENFIRLHYVISIETVHRSDKLLKKDFVWRGKRPKIKHLTLIGDCKEGGYKDVDIEAKIMTLKITWINKLMADDFHAWEAIPNFLFDKIGIRSVFHYNFKPSKNTLQQIPYIHNSVKNLYHSGSLLVKGNLRASLKLLDNVFE